MHNLHLVRTYASTPKEACSLVESYIMDWGNENNWRTITGCVSQDDEPYEHEQGRFSSVHSNSIELINKMVNGWLEPTSFYKESFERCSKGEEEPHDWYGAKKHCEHMGQITFWLKLDRPFDVLTDVFFEGVYDELGVSDTYETPNEGDKLFIVFVDMHS